MTIPKPVRRGDGIDTTGDVLTCEDNGGIVVDPVPLLRGLAESTHPTTAGPVTRSKTFGRRSGRTADRDSSALERRGAGRLWCDRDGVRWPFVE